MTSKIEQCILCTLLNKEGPITDLEKYEIVISYLESYRKEICEHIFQAVNLEYPNYSIEEKINLLKDVNYCISKAYEYIYFLELNLEMQNLSR